MKELFSATPLSEVLVASQRGSGDVRLATELWREKRHADVEWLLPLQTFKSSPSIPRQALGVVGHALSTQNQSWLRQAKANRFVTFRWQCHFSPQSARGLLVSAD
jgi:hypothetical protein